MKNFLRRMLGSEPSPKVKNEVVNLKAVNGFNHTTKEAEDETEDEEAEEETPPTLVQAKQCADDATTTGIHLKEVAQAIAARAGCGHACQRAKLRRVRFRRECGLMYRAIHITPEGRRRFKLKTTKPSAIYPVGGRDPLGTQFLHRHYAIAYHEGHDFRYENGCVSFSPGAEGWFVLVFEAACGCGEEHHISAKFCPQCGKATESLVEPWS